MNYSTDQDPHKELRLAHTAHAMMGEKEESASSKHFSSVLLKRRVDEEKKSSEENRLWLRN